MIQYETPQNSEGHWRPISGKKYPKMIEGTFQLKQFPSGKSKIPIVGYSSAYITRQYPYNNLPMVFSANMGIP